MRSWSLKARAAVLVSGLVAIVAVRAIAGDPAPPAPAPGPSTPPAAFAIWYAPAAPADGETLEAVLRGKGDASIRTYLSFREWAASDADVLVLRGCDETGVRIPDEGTIGGESDFTALQGKRVLGIGWESRRLFTAMGLEIENTASFERDRADVIVEGGSLLPDVKRSRIEAFDSSLRVGGKAKWRNEALHMPRWGYVATKVEALTRWADDDDYAPLARQQNYVYCGIAADVGTWTPPFRELVGQIGGVLRTRPLEPFSLVNWPATPPGSYEFTLTRGSRPRDRYERAFFFTFDKPVLFSARIQQEGSNAIMLFFSARKTRRSMERLDGKDGETLDLLIPITAECIRENGGRYWRLVVDNFDFSTARCKLRIDYGASDVVRFPDGLSVAMSSPPNHEKSIATLIERFRSPDLATRRLAHAALLIVGRAALPMLDAAQGQEKDIDDAVRFAMLIGAIQGE